MDEMLPFLRAIAANPDDDTPRLVFSDWLEEHDHHERAEFIRLQIELARMDASDEGYADKTARMRRCGVFTRPGKVPFFDHLPSEKCQIAFGRGFIETLDTANAEMLDTSGFDLVPLRSLYTGDKLVDQFKGFAKLKQLDFRGWSHSPPRLLEILGPKGWFPDLEQLSLSTLDSACLDAGVIARFDLPRLRNFFIITREFTRLGTLFDTGSDDADEEEDDYRRERTWGGLPEHLPRNALPNAKSPLERFIWHSEDDSDSYDDGWEWRGPAMESLLEQLKAHALKQIEVIVDHDDHESGGEGVIAAPRERNPLESHPTLEQVTLDISDLHLLEGSSRKPKSLRVYGDGRFREAHFAILAQPVCSDLESLHIETRGWWSSEPTAGPKIIFAKLRSLEPGTPLGLFSNCDFPNLISLSGGHDLQPILVRKWPRLQRLSIDVGSKDLSDLRAFAQSDCCPNLTTLSLADSFDPTRVDLSFLAKCSHMPFLSLIETGSRNYIVDEGQLLPVRADVLVEEPQPNTLHNISVVF